MDQKQVTKKLQQLHSDSSKKVVRYTTNILVEQILWGYTVANFLIAFGLFNFHSSTTLFVANSVSLVRVWSFVFLLTGMAMLWGLLSHSLRMLRYSTLFAVFIKMSWLLALVVRITIGGSLLITALWALVTYIQFWVYFYLTMESRHVQRL